VSKHRNIMLGTAGHVDHGKTAIVKMITGCNTDSLAEEQKRGLTIDLGFAPCQMADENIVGVIDVPGHVDFIRNMVAGAHGIDVVIFVVAADDGVMPQTREHLDILTLMGTRSGIVALTKIDLMDKLLRELIVEDLRKLLAGTFLAGAPICGVSNITGEGYDHLLEALNTTVAACPDRTTAGMFRMWVEDVYTIHGHGTVVTGIPSQGSVTVGDHLRLLPADKPVRVRSMEVYGQESNQGLSGQCVAINLSGVEAGGIHRGMVLGQGPGLVPATMVEASLKLLGRFARPLKDNSQVHLHIGTAEIPASIALLDAKELPPGESMMVQLRFDKPIALAPGERFVVRTDLGGQTGGTLTTIGGGRILSTSNMRLRRNRPWTIAALNDRLAAIDDKLKFAEVVLKQACEPITAAKLAEMLHAKLDEAQKLAGELTATGLVVGLSGGRLIHHAGVQALAKRLACELEMFHITNPLRLGAEVAQLAGQLQAQVELVELAAAELANQNRLQRKGTLLALPGRGANISAKNLELCQQIETAMKAGHLTPPSPAELAATLSANEATVEKLLAMLADQKTLVKLGPQLYMHADAVQQARNVALELFRTSQAGAFETVEFRDALGVSRKFAVPLLDYFDTIRLTVRSGSRRTPGAAARPAIGQ
jgi:selenocysteine-specific elongation factor